MARTVLFFGDSNTRGFGAGIEARFPTLLESALAQTFESPWRYAVGHSVSDFHVFPERLDAALSKHRPDVVVLQCPTGPATFWIKYPNWIRWFISVSAWSFKRLQELYIRLYSRDRSRDVKARREALYEGKFVDPLYRWNLAQWNGPRQIRRWFARRYGTVQKASGPRYVQLMCRLRDRLRSQSGAKVLILGLLPHSEDYYPGYHERAREYCKLLAAALHRPEEGIVYCDLYDGLMQGGFDGMVISDGKHLSPEGHRRLASIVAPPLKQLMSDCELSGGAIDSQRA
jgi:lysophospholipase L1-like esterase